MSGVKRAHASKERKDDEGNSDVINPIKRHKSEITGMQKCTSGRRRGRSLFLGLHAWAWNMIEGLPAVSGHQRWVGFQNPWISHFYQISAPFTKWKTNAAEISTLGLMLSQRNWIHNQIWLWNIITPYLYDNFMFLRHVAPPSSHRKWRLKSRFSVSISWTSACTCSWLLCNWCSIIPSSVIYGPVHWQFLIWVLSRCSRESL